MKTIKVSNLSGAALDWAVAKCEGVSVEYVNDGITQCLLCKPSGRYAPSTNWMQGGPIIERERIRIRFETECYWYFTTPTDTWIANYEGVGEWLGPTPLIAAMRCYVASKLGNEMEIPDELAV